MRVHFCLRFAEIENKRIEKIFIAFFKPIDSTCLTKKNNNRTSKISKKKKIKIAAN